MKRVLMVTFVAAGTLLGSALAGVPALADTDSVPEDEPSPQECENPGQVLDLSDWKIQLPIGEEESPDEVTQPEFATYQADPWFTVAPECDGVLFRSAVNGVTTGGSDYPRSELREMSSDGTDEAGWSATDGTHAMTINQTVTHLPNDKEHMVVGQIHGGDDDVSVFRVEGSNLYVTNGDDSNHHLVTDNFQLNTPFQVKFVVADGTIEAFYNGELTTTLDADFSDGYFKAGAYTQANCENSSPCDESNYGEVILHDVTLGEDAPPPPDSASVPDSDSGSDDDSEESGSESAPACEADPDFDSEPDSEESEESGDESEDTESDSDSESEEPDSDSDSDSEESGDESGDSDSGSDSGSEESDSDSDSDSESDSEESEESDGESEDSDSEPGDESEDSDCESDDESEESDSDSDSDSESAESDSDPVADPSPPVSEVTANGDDGNDGEAADGGKDLGTLDDDRVMAGGGDKDSSGGLPVTGTALSGLVAAALVALGIGGTAIYLSRKRRTALAAGEDAGV